MISCDNFVDVSKFSPIKEEVKEDIKCQYCHKQFKVKSFFIKHKCKQMTRMKMKQEKEQFKQRESQINECIECDKKFKTPGHYKIHLKAPLHLNIQFNCNICDSIFRYKHRYDKHMSYHSDLSLTCNECNKMFATKSKLKTHQREIHLIRQTLYIPCRDILLLFYYTKKFVICLLVP